MSSIICPFQDQAKSIPALQWFSILTLCLAPLVIHIAGGVSDPDIIGGKPPEWTDRLPLFNPVSILWRYFAIADKRARSKNWSEDDMAFSNAAIWNGKIWDGSEEMMIKCRDFPSKLPASTRVDFVSASTLITITTTLQGINALYRVATKGSEGDVASFFAPLAVVSLYRLPAAIWLSSDCGYQRFLDWEAPPITSIKLEIANRLYSAHSWRGILFRFWWLCSTSAIAAFAIYKCGIGLFFDNVPGEEGCSISVASLFQRIFYTMFVLGLVGIHAVYVLISRSTSTVIPCVQSGWYKVFTWGFMFVAIVGAVIASIETRLATECGDGSYTSYPVSNC